MSSRIIQPVRNNIDKQRTYSDNIRRYNRALKQGFYFEAILIDYALMEDRLRSFIYYIGGLRSTDNYRIGKGVVRDKLTEIVEHYKLESENSTLGITNISGKIKIIRSTLLWAASIERKPEDRYLKTLKSQYEGQLDIGGLIETLKDIEIWCKYRNELIHALMNKNMGSVDERIEEQAVKGMALARYLDGQIKSLKKGNRIRRVVYPKQAY